MSNTISAPPVELDSPTRLTTRLKDVNFFRVEHSRSPPPSIPREPPPFDNRVLQIIPTEIWLAIFRYAIDSTVQDHLHEPLRLKQFLFPPPITLSHVCRLWRSILFEFNHLWSTLPVCPREYWTKGEAETVAFARKGARGALAQSTSTANGTPITLLFDVSERFDSKESRLRYLRDRQRARLTETHRSLDGREPLLFPEGGYSVYLFLRPANPEMARPVWRVHPKAPVEIRHIVRIGGKDSPKPTSLTLHWPRRSGFTAQIASLVHSYGAKSVTLIDNFPHDTSYFGLLYTTITSLRLKTTEKQRLIPLDAMLLPWLEELYIHSCRIDINEDRPSLQDLRVLGITPVHVSFFAVADLPHLDTVIFYPPDIKPRSRRLGEDWVTKMAEVIKTITKLEFEGWPEKYQRNVVYYSVVPLCLALLHQLPRLKAVTFRQSFVWGEGLVEGFPVASGLKVGAALEELVLDECTGVTRAHCEALASIVGRIKIF